MRRHTLVLVFIIESIVLGQGAVARGAGSTTGATLHVAESAYGLGCAESKAIVEKSFLDIKGVKTADVDFQAAKVLVSYDSDVTTPGTIANAFNKENEGLMRVEVPVPDRPR